MNSSALGLGILRVGIGVLFIIHGYLKIWGEIPFVNVGGAMGYLGISFWHGFWGVLAAFTEFFGGIFLLTGFYPRIPSFFLAFMMIVALVFHLNMGHDFKEYSHPLALFFVFVGLTYMGGRTIQCTPVV